MGGSSALLGWAGILAARLDQAEPGFLNELFVVDVKRRQVLFAAMSRVDPETVERGPAEVRRDIGRRLRFARSRDIVVHFFGFDPPGFRRSLAKAGPQPKARRFYGKLHDKLAAAQTPREVRTVQAMTAVSGPALNILDLLDPAAQLPNVVGVLTKRPEAEAVNALLTLLRTVCSEATDDNLIRSLRQIRSLDDFEGLGRYWLNRADRLPPPPWPGTNRLRPLADGRAIRAAAREFHNCLVDRFGDVLYGRAYFYCWRYRDRKAVVELLSDPPIGWRLGEVLGPNNVAVPPATLGAIRNELAAAGITRRETLSERLWPLPLEWGRFG